MSLRFTPTAAAAWAAALREADPGGRREVFAVGDVEAGEVVGITVVARGSEDAVLALRSRARPGQVVIHNHPSGDVRPSEPDLVIAHRFGEDGIGFVITDSAVQRANWVVEPVGERPATLDLAAVDRVFDELLPAAVPGWETRAPQRTMAHAVATALHDNRPVYVEAGTGTGKSLAYLVPAALWAAAHQGTVVIATHTRALQAQLLRSDLPLLARAGLEVRAAVLEGRGNYLCKRRAALAQQDAAVSADAGEEEAAALLQSLLEWSEGSPTGSRSDLPLHVPYDLWERVLSDGDLTLRNKCEHYETCHFYAARRKAAGASIVVVNHALLLADLVLKHDGAPGVLPPYQRVVVDEAHHLEEVATGAGSRKVTARAISRALAPLHTRRKRVGALTRLVSALESHQPAKARPVEGACAAVEALSEDVQREATRVLGDLLAFLDSDEPARRVDEAFAASDDFTQHLRPQLARLSERLAEVAAGLDGLAETVGADALPERHAQPLLDIRRAARRVRAHANDIAAFLDGDARHTARWIDTARSRGEPVSGALCTAPIEVDALLREILWEPLPGAVATSATLTVAGDLAFWRGRTGAPEAEGRVLPSPFDHASQALLGLPTDLCDPAAPDFLRMSAHAVVDAVSASRGGAFVLCTSHRAVAAYAEALSAALPPHHTVLRQGTLPRPMLLARFMEDHHAVLVGTDSFWEGVSVKGDGLRLVVIPKLPFRVPSDPLERARHEAVTKRGLDPFRALTLPAAALKLRQGYGRLLRAATDRGVVVVLDPRLHQRSYGRVLLASLPGARRVKGPWVRVHAEIARFFATVPTAPPHASPPPAAPPRAAARSSQRAHPAPASGAHAPSPAWADGPPDWLDEAPEGDF